jgi:hypothetical protein
MPSIDATHSTYAKTMTALIENLSSGVLTLKQTTHGP